MAGHADEASTGLLSLQEAVRRAGSDEAVVLALRKGDKVAAQAAAFSNGREAGPIPRYWWDAKPRFDPANGQVVFTFSHTGTDTYEVRAFGVEILGAEALWPTKPEPQEEATPELPREEATLSTTDLAASPLREDALRWSLEAALRGLRHGPQIDRVYPALWMEFPPRGKAPKLLSIKRIAERLRPYWKAEREKLGLEIELLPDPSDDVVEAAVNELGRSDD